MDMITVNGCLVASANVVAPFAWDENDVCYSVVIT